MVGCNIIFAPSFVNSSYKKHFKCCDLNDLIYIFLDNGVMTTPKRGILLFAFTVLCLKKSLLIRIMKMFIFVEGVFSSVSCYGEII